MNETKINWTEKTWNPASGCKVVSEECQNCYALALAENRRGTAAFPNGFDLTIRPHKLNEPFGLKRPSLIFVNSMSDFAFEDIPDSYRDRIIDVMNKAPQHRYQVLTKRPENAARYFKTRKVPASMWLGVTVGHEKRVDRIRILQDIDAPVRFISIEPLLTPLEGLQLDGIHWVITGGESGVHLAKPEVAERRSLARRATDAERRAGAMSWVPRDDRAPWIHSIRDQCVAAGVAYYHKQWGGVRPESAGRMVEGRTWDEMPEFGLPDGYKHFERAPAHLEGKVQRTLPVVQ